MKFFCVAYSQSVSWPEFCGSAANALYFALWCVCGAFGCVSGGLGAIWGIARLVGGWNRPYQVIESMLRHDRNII